MGNSCTSDVQNDETIDPFWTLIGAPHFFGGTQEAHGHLASFSVSREKDFMAGNRTAERDGCSSDMDIFDNPMNFYKSDILG